MNTPRFQGWLWLVVALQIAIPAAYYLRADDPDDERFAWRMFSGVRMRRCNVRVYEFGGQQPVQVPLHRTLHSSWVHALERGRWRVMERFLPTRCGAPAVRRVALERRCEDLDAARYLERYVYDCERRELRRIEVR